MSKPPRIKEASSRPPKPEPARPKPVRTLPPPPPVRLPPLVDRIGAMSDADLVMLQTNAVRIINTAGHPKHASATDALPAIEAEIGRRAGELQSIRSAAAEARASSQKAQRSAAAAAKAAAKGPSQPKS